ncbi:MAG: winged helix-turn-helix domain-containing protein [Rhodoferax sp.]|nr:MAG: winged helix-turn-helix domain-containing protein [Rhodoferax sp.]
MISLQQARNLHLAAQGLLTTPPKKPTRKHLLAAIARMELLQIDTIHVVARSPYLVLHARLGDYPLQWLDDALAQGSIFETWAHEACFAPTADWPWHRACNAQVRCHWGLKHAQRTLERDGDKVAALLQHIADTGPVRSADFARPDVASSPWWGWKDEKRWLEALFANGDLMVARREKFQRVYDLTQRVLPAALRNAPLPSPAQVRNHMLQTSVRALGVAQAAWLHDYFRLKPRFSRAELDAAVATGTLLQVAVDGWDAPGYVHPDHAALLRRAEKGTLTATHTALLSPFDPVVWDRARALDFFGFDYRLECYTPAPQRRYGYFVLPVLCRGELIGRLDAKAHRTDGMLEVKSLYSESATPWSAEQLQDVAQALWRFARWQGLSRITLGAAQPERMAAALRRALAQTETTP